MKVRNENEFIPLKVYLYIITNCILVDSSTFICWVSPFVILGVSGFFIIYYIFDGKSCLQTVYSVDCDQIPHYVGILFGGLHYHIMWHLDLGSALFAYDPFTGFQVRMG